MTKGLFIDKDITKIIIASVLGQFIRGFAGNFIKEIVNPSIHDIFGDPKFTINNIEYDLSNTVNSFISLIIIIYIIVSLNKPLKPNHWFIRMASEIRKSNPGDLKDNEKDKIRKLSAMYSIVVSMLLLIGFLITVNLFFRKKLDE